MFVSLPTVPRRLSVAFPFLCASVASCVVFVLNFVTHLSFRLCLGKASGRLCFVIVVFPAYPHLYLNIVKIKRNLKKVLG